MSPPHDHVRFDLVADDEGGPGDGGGTAGAGSAGEPTVPGWFSRHVGGPVRARWRATPRRLQIGIVAVTTVAVVGAAAGIAALDARADAAHAEHMAAMPGGVADLSEPLHETWRVETDDGVLAVLPDGVVVTRDGADVLGVDAATGEEVWRHELGALAECGSRSTGAAVAPSGTLVCVHGAGERTATVLDATGVVLGERDLGFANWGREIWDRDAPQILPAQDGTIAVLERATHGLALDPTDPVADLARARSEGRWQDPTVRVEDALTGEVRGEATLELRTAADLAGCATSDGPDGSSTLHVAPTLWVWGGEVHFSVCRESVALSTDGERSEPVRYPSVDGGFVQPVEGGTRLVDASGDVERTIPGAVVEPTVVDGTTGPRLVLVEEGRLAGLGDGDRLWTADAEEIDGYLARADGVAVLLLDDGTVSAVDLGTGDVRWTRDDLSPGDHGGVHGAATDGSIALLTVTGGPLTDLVAVDLDDGRTVWSTTADARYGSVSVVAGRPVLVDAMGGGFVTTVDGVQVETADAALVGLAPEVLGVG
ncbi:PQQ-binding-like beta-propeller repeat protein [Isoptericola sediminis]|uniref:PQQ-binding-like beta-propeller repeat protein n=1 Tax=Isoptericola sediminis TaxID=2733572 RepID=A0A849K3T1_9MICO|nr:PQQ-binding-like beta-propeller repeat protein [Isoptericola sediminis]NNU26699.1 PQQ-binding-like beta-propeller repeat protein [Isoptericola sediminis]